MQQSKWSKPVFSECWRKKRHGRIHSTHQGIRARMFTSWSGLYTTSTTNMYNNTDFTYRIEGVGWHDGDVQFVPSLFHGTSDVVVVGRIHFQRFHTSWQPLWRVRRSPKKIFWRRRKGAKKSKNIPISRSAVYIHCPLSIQDGTKIVQQNTRITRTRALPRCDHCRRGKSLAGTAAACRNVRRCLWKFLQNKSRAWHLKISKIEKNVSIDHTRPCIQT